MEHACLDAGIFSIYFSTNCTTPVQELMNKIKNGTCDAYVLKSVLCEVYYHLCEISGRETATIQITSLIHTFPLMQVDLDEALIQLTGTLKCQHKNTLSYIDCMSIAFCLQNRIPFHSTEKTIKKIPHNTLQRLKIVKYQFES